MIRLVVAAVAISLLAILTTSPKASSGYRYYGTHVGRPSRTTVSLDSAIASSGHAAVWLGASTATDSAWVQGGIAYEGVQPFIYIEFKRPGHYPCLVAWGASFGQKVGVRIEDHSARWRVLIDGHLSRSILMLHPALISTLETYGDASGSGTIGGRRVTS